MTLWKRDRPFSWWLLKWTDTGERPWWWCLLGGVMFAVLGLTAFYREHVFDTVLLLLCAGYNIGALGMVDRRSVDHRKTNE